MRLPLLLSLLAACGCNPRTPAPEGRPCDEDGTCGPGTYCDPQTRTCLAGPAPDAGPPCQHPEVIKGTPHRYYCMRKDLEDEWQVIPRGCFAMGSPESEACRLGGETQHLVTLTHPFEIGTTEVTQAAFLDCAGYNPSLFQTYPNASLPVERATWHDAVEYCNSRSKVEHIEPCYVNVVSPERSCTSTEDCEAEEVCINSSCKRYEPAPDYAGSKIYECPGYRLPTEAEWEYAYRAGTRTALYDGDIDVKNCGSRDPNADRIAIYGVGKTQNVGQRRDNDWGLFDLAGNVREWCHDSYSEDPLGGAVTDPVGDGSKKITRGGSYLEWPSALRAAARGQFAAAETFETVGFRCVISQWNCRPAADCLKQCSSLECVQSECTNHLCESGKAALDAVLNCAMQLCLDVCKDGFNTDCWSCVQDKCKDLNDACQSHRC